MVVESSLLRLALVAILILANSFFVAAEFAIVSVRETRVQQLLSQGRHGAALVLDLKARIEQFLPAAQLGVTLVALALGSLGEPVIVDLLLQGAHALHINADQRLLEPIALAVAFASITFFEVLLGELVPKSLALQRAERIALAIAAPMDVFIRLTRPAVLLMNHAATIVLRLFRAPLSGEGIVHSPQELKLVTSATRKMDLLSSFQEQIIHRAIDLAHLTVREIMTPRGRMVLLPADLTLDQASARFIEEQHSRVPVFDPQPRPDAADEHDRIIGVVYSKDVARLMHFLSRAPGLQALSLRDMMHPLPFVPETKLAVELLREFQRDRRQIAIVVDEFGSTTGLVTAEDTLEQIVGELEDEFDSASHTPVLTASSDLTLDGATPLRDLANQLLWHFPREAGVETLAGFLLSQFGHIPGVGEQLEYEGRLFTVTDMDGRRIARIRVQTADAEQTTADDAAARAAS